MNRLKLKSGWSKDKFRKKLKISNKDFVIVKVANLHHYKGHSDLLNACDTLKYKIPYLKCIFIGNDMGEKKFLKSQIVDKNLGSNILILENVTDISGYLKIADLGVLVSHEEGFSNALLEYMAAGLPVVATSVGGNQEIVQDKISGFLVPPKNPRMIAAAILRIYKSNRKSNMGKSAKERTLETFSNEKILKEYEDLYLSKVHYD